MPRKFFRHALPLGEARSYSRGVEIDTETGAAVLTIVSLKYGTFRVLIDPEDWDRASQHKWAIAQTKKDRRHGRVYFRTQMRSDDGKKRGAYLHRFILGEPKGLMVDFRDPAATLDCRKSNLRIATNGQNNENTRKRVCNAGKPPSSRFKGVTFDKRDGTWYVRVQHNKRRRNLGNFPITPEGEIDAARAYDCGAREYHGEFALLNFPDSLASDCTQIAA